MINADDLLDALDDLYVGGLTDDQLARLAQVLDALAVEVDQEYARRDD